MKKRRGRTRNERPVSAKELAEMGFCEKRVLLAHLHGQQLTAEQRRSVERGRLAHERYYREGLAAASERSAHRRCFIATCLYGDAAWQTEAMRRYRDEVLLTHRWGRQIVFVYYALAPSLCRLLTRLPWLQLPARALVGMIVCIVRCRAEGRA
jgi:hypothetical protein